MVTYRITLSPSPFLPPPDPPVPRNPPPAVPQAVRQDQDPDIPGGRAAQLRHAHEGGGHAHGAGGDAAQGEVEDQPQNEEVRSGLNDHRWFLLFKSQWFRTSVNQSI